MLREVKVGALIVAALAVLSAGVFLVGERGNLFVLKNHYYVRFQTASGLAAGNPVQLNGVTVGRVESIVLPEKVEQSLLTVWISLDRRYADRVRTDSLGRIKTLGLLGDKYIELSSGSPGAPQIASGGEIPAAPATDVDRLIASGGDAVENVVAISYSLRTILGRMEAGEGILGELTTDNDAGRRAKVALVETIESIRDVAEKIEQGDGTLARLINDDALADRLEGAIGRVEGTLASLDEGEGALPALLHDPATRVRVESTLDNLAGLSDDLAGMASELKSGDGLLARLVNDDEYGREVTEDLQQLIRNLHNLSEKMERGEGTVSRLVNDPQVYEAVNDVIVGVNESRLLRWLVRNRQKAGIQKRYEDELQAAAPGAEKPEQ